MNFTNIFGSVAKELNFLPTAIMAVEQLLPGHTGAEKKQAVQNLAATTFNAMAAFDSDLIPGLTNLSPAVGLLIDGTVALFNAKNIFGFGTKPVPAPAPAPGPVAVAAPASVAVAAPADPAPQPTPQAAPAPQPAELIRTALQSVQTAIEATLGPAQPAAGFMPHGK